MLSNSSKYAIKAVLFLAVNSNENKKVMIKDISKPINVPQAYVAKLLQELSRLKIVSSNRGPKGGFYLNSENRNQSLMNIINAFEGEKKITTCMLSLENCNKEKPCPLHNTIYPFKSEIIKSLQKTTINDLCIQIKLGNAFLPL